MCSSSNGVRGGDDPVALQDRPDAKALFAEADPTSTVTAPAVEPLRSGR